MDTTDNPTPRCGHTYTTNGGRTFTCVALPHPTTDGHYYRVLDATA
jgi:hypothetical protein